MRRGEVAVAKAFSPSNQFERMAEQLPASRGHVRPPSPPPDEPTSPAAYQPYGPPVAPRRSYSKHRKAKLPPAMSPCVKFAAGTGCVYGDKCRFSHEFQGFFPPYYEYGMPKTAPANFPNPPQRERAASFSTHWKKPQTNQHSHAPPSPKRLFKEVVMGRRKTKKAPEVAPYAAPSPPKPEADESDIENQNNNWDSSVEEYSKPQFGSQRQQQRRKKPHGRPCAPSCDGMPWCGNADPPEVLRNPNIFSDIGNTRAEYVQQLTQQQRQQQQFYTRPVNAAQLLHSVFPPYPQYMPAEQFYSSSLSRQTELFVESVDCQLAAMELHQQQAIDSLQELVRSLWPDAFIDVYGSNYTRLALPESDIDCVLVSRSLTSEPPLMILEALAAEAERQPWTKRLDLLGKAKIPVLKMSYSFDPTQRDVLLDLTCTHSVGHSGLGARDLIYSFQAEMPALRPLVLILKTHLVSNDLNCAFSGGISSYVLVVMVIRFLQACGDCHYKSFASTIVRKIRHGGRRRSNSENTPMPEFPDEFAFSSYLGDDALKPKWCYTFSRNGRVTWRTGIGSLLMLFLETYITFDYHRFGISIDKEGKFFLLPPDKVDPVPGSVVIPYVADPIKPGRSICNCFRMHEVIQSWLTLYQNLAAGGPVAACVTGSST